MRLRRAGCLVVLLAACALMQPAAAAARTLTIGLTQFPSTFHPNMELSVAKSYVQGMTLRPLTAYDADWELICMLCVELPTFENGGAVRRPGEGENGGDAVSLTYRIRPGATWGDGVPVSTEDVLFTRQVGSHPQSGVGNQELYSDITGIDVVDDKTFVMHVKKLTFNYNAINDFRLLPAHLEREPFEGDPVNYRTRTTFDRDPINPGLAFGPYRMTEVSPGAYVVLDRNPTWWGEPAAFERIVVRVVENTAALEASLLSGDIDMIAGELGLSIDQALAFEQRNGDDYRIVYKPGLFYEHLDVRLDNPILKDVRVRRALLYGIDREALVTQLFGGHQPVALSSVSPLDSVFTEDVPTYAYDVERAGALLDEAGWSAMRGGIRHDASGRPLRLEIATTAGNRTRELVEQVVQAQLRAVGVDLVIRNEPARVLFGQTLSRRGFTGLALFGWVSSPENPPRSTLHSEEIPSAANGWSGQNYTGYSNPRMDALLDAIEIELDPERRNAIWAEIQRLYATDLPVLPLYFRSDAHVWPLWLEGVVPTGHLNPSTLWVETWRAAEAG